MDEAFAVLSAALARKSLISNGLRVSYSRRVTSSIDSSSGAGTWLEIRCRRRSHRDGGMGENPGDAPPHDNSMMITIPQIVNSVFPTA